MKYQSSNTKSIFNIEFSSKRNICPECSHNRKKKNNKCLEYHSDTNTAYCFNCNTTFFEYKPYDKKFYNVPEWKNETKLTDKAVKWFTGRMISQGTLNKTKIYSSVEYMPQFQKEVEVMCFPYFFEGKLINIKYRGAKKSFKLHSGAELILMNLDALKEYNEIIFVEGEIDYLTYIENGYDNVVSVPNGANKNLEYLDEYIELFDQIKTVYISVDNDSKGIELRDELTRRLGFEKCKIVTYKECKDANEYFIRYGGIEFKELLNNAKEVRIEGVIYAENMHSELRDLFINGVTKGAEINDPEIDEFVSWELRRLAIATGVPGCGKSEIVDYIVTKLNLIHKWKAAFFSPENYPMKIHYSKIYEKLAGKEFSSKHSNDIEFDITYEYINDNFFWILNEDDLTIDKILENAKYLVKTKGIKVLVIDPYNKIDHQFSNNITETQYISKFLDKLIMFGKLNNILIFLIAHPRKMEAGKIPTLYDISGSANFYNKTDYGFTVHREFNESNLMTNEVQIHWQKIKFKNLGSQGISEKRYNYKNGRLESRRNSIDSWDNSTWIVKDDNIDLTNFWDDKSEEDEAPF